MAILLIPIVGGIGLASEVSGWSRTERAMQNAADSAALSAASNGRTTAPTYGDEARAVASGLGFPNGSNNTIVTALNAQACPDGINSNCYRVTITKDLPVRLVRVVGFNGNQGGGALERVTATALASTTGAGEEPCFTLLGTGNTFVVKGGPSMNLAGCVVSTAGSANCNSSHNFQIDYVYAAGSADCATINDPQHNVSGATPPTDTFAQLSTAANIPTSTGCDAATTIAAGTLNLSAFTSTQPKKYCGSVTIAGAVTVTTASPGSVIIIYGGGSLTVNGSLSAAVGSGLTVIFSGTAGNNTPGFLAGGGSFDWGAPTTGTWSGVAVYQDHRMTKAQNITYAGNSPALNLTGLAYMPFATLTLKGNIGHQTNGLACLSLMAQGFQANGNDNGSIFSGPTNDCRQAGLTLPTFSGGNSRAQLVQ
jgi:hypothetical protein